MDCNSVESYKKNSNPYAKTTCCPNMKREAKKWAKIKHNGKIWCIKTCCNNCIVSIQNGLKKGDKYMMKKNTLYRNFNKEWSPVFKCQTLEQVMKKLGDKAEFRN